MALRRQTPSRPLDAFDQFFEGWPTWFRRPVMLLPEGMDDTLRVDEFRDDDTEVIRADIAGIDPEKDVEITVSNGVLHIEAHRREEEKKEGKDFYRRELRYGSFSRDLVLPEGATEADVKATYKDGILEVRVPVPAPKAAGTETKKIPISKS
jgi:HSP20 family protein